LETNEESLVIRANEDESGVNDEMAHLINDC